MSASILLTKDDVSPRPRQWRWTFEAAAIALSIMLIVIAVEEQSALWQVAVAQESAADGTRAQATAALERAD